MTKQEFVDQVANKSGLNKREWRELAAALGLEEDPTE